MSPNGPLVDPFASPTSGARGWIEPCCGASINGCVSKRNRQEWCNDLKWNFITTKNCHSVLGAHNALSTKDRMSKIRTRYLEQWKLDTGLAVPFAGEPSNLVTWDSTIATKQTNSKVRLAQHQWRSQILGAERVFWTVRKESNKRPQVNMNTHPRRALPTGYLKRARRT